jgi:prepilin-type N-terminal cleavage/methylation domain-containing protein
MQSAFRSRGFTLIELLIVVAIIAILAAIAVPNFLEAQMRSKVSRVMSDQRTIGVAVESYRVDNNKLPAWVGDATLPTWYSNTTGFYRQLTTPVAYATSASIFEDPFVSSRGGNFWKWYAIAPSYALPGWGDHTKPNERVIIQTWGIRSYGPDQDDDGTRNQSIILYDATNGTISDGDIWRIDNIAVLDGSYYRDRR